MRVIRFLAGHLYMKQPLSADQLPYTPELAQIRRRYNQIAKQDVNERDIYLCIQGLRKSGSLPKKKGQVK